MKIEDFQNVDILIMDKKNFNYTSSNKKSLGKVSKKKEDI